MRGGNIIGTPPVIIPLDPDAAAFLTATGITDATITSAIDTLVKDLKANNIWTKMKAIYPFVGGAASAHAVDLITLTSGSFSGGFTHNANGITGNGTNAFFNTGKNMNAILNQNSNSIGYYNRTTNPTNNGYSGVGTPNWFVIGKATSPQQGTDYWANSAASLFDNLGSVNRFIIGNRTSSTAVAIYRNNILTASASRTSQAIPTNNFYISATNNAGNPTLYSNMNFSFWYFSDGLTLTDIANLTTCVNTFQTTLSRNV
jgi:hypothetical protein